MNATVTYALSRRFFKNRRRFVSQQTSIPSSLGVHLHKPRLLGVAVLAALGTAIAEDSQDRDFNRRLYIGLGAGVTDLDPESRTPALVDDNERDSGGQIFLGMDLSPRFSLEGYYADLGSAGIEFLGDAVGEVNYQVYGLSLLGYFGNSRDADDYLDCTNCEHEGLYRREGLSPYLRLGLGGMINESELAYDRDHSVHLTVGGGLEYGWPNGFALRAEITSFDTDAHYAGLSALYRFGDADPRMAAVPGTAPDAALRSIPGDSLDLGIRPFDFPIPTFGFDQYGLSAEAKAMLGSVVAQLQADPDLKLKLIGHTDSRGSHNYNQNLSLRRAASVRNFLIDQGVDANRLVVAGEGETNPVAPNETDEGRALNRRVQISNL